MASRRGDAGWKLSPRVVSWRGDAGWSLSPLVTGRCGKSCIAGIESAFRCMEIVEVHLPPVVEQLTQVPKISSND